MLGPAKRAATAPQLSSSSSPASSPESFKEPRPKIGIVDGRKFDGTPTFGVLPHELPEWIETDSIDGEVSRLVSARQSGKSRRCCRNSTSSGYSSHSPPLSAHSYGVIVGPVAAAKALAVIQEGEIIPRPIWPSPPDSTGEHSPDNVSSDDNAEREPQPRPQPSIYGSAGYRSSVSSDYGGPASSVSAREVLLELSRTLSSVLEGDCGKSDEEILRDISRTVAQGVDAKPAGSSTASGRAIYEDIYRNSSLTSSGKESSSTIGVNPINSRLYGHRCYCEHKTFLCQSHPSSSQETTPKSDGRKKPTIFLLPDDHAQSFLSAGDKNRIICSCRSYKESCNLAPDKLGSKKNLGKQCRNPNDPRQEKEIRFNYPSIAEHEYTTLECSDESSSSEAVTDSVNGNNTWCKDFRGFDRNLDFTLDGLRAERLGRAIARAKRRRQWCRVLVVVLGLVFFILSVVVVSLSVTKGRKIFGSM
ncbi:uncharacterized protein LOC100679525 [Nasonia vitripennis]|uniref:Uncharacterized protein n=1 Tax=Nasonia vitripennis TaxID=7425 RepID=A0A7M7GF88_NASVI|nr:uncharacterized protein LOC100679525 [Nasonia vitripennis]